MLDIAQTASPNCFNKCGIIGKFTINHNLFSIFSAISGKYAGAQEPNWHCAAL